MRVCVLGSGIAGTMTAYYLSERGHDVIIVDRQPGSALETSKANACLLVPSQALPWNAPGIVRQSLKWILEENGALVVRPRLDPAMLAWLVRFALYARPVLHKRHALATLGLARLSLLEVDAIAAKHAIAFHRTRRGVITLLRTPAVRQGSLASLRLINGIGERCRLLERAELLASEPSLEPIADRIDSALLTEDDGSGDIYKFCAGVERLLPGRGVSFRFGEDVQVLTSRRGRVVSARTSKGDIEADAFVLALGIDSRSMARPLGIDLKMYPVQGCTISIDADGWNGMPSRPIRDAALKVAVTPLGNRIRVAGMAILNSGSLEMPARHFATIRRALSEIFPTLPPDCPSQEWTGLRPMTPDGPPLLGPTPFPNLWLNTGHGQLGWTIGCASAKLVAGLIDGEPSPVPLDPFRYDRYRF